MDHPGVGKWLELVFGFDVSVGYKCVLGAKDLPGVEARTWACVVLRFVWLGSISWDIAGNRPSAAVICVQRVCLSLGQALRLSGNTTFACFVTSCWADAISAWPGAVAGERAFCLPEYRYFAVCVDKIFWIWGHCLGIR
jgi:hypothetical protein